MIKNILFVLLLTCFSCLAQNKPLFSKILIIRYTHQDKIRKNKEMTFFYEDNKIYGRITIPNIDSLISAKTKIDKASLKTLDSFITLVRQYKNSCKEEKSKNDDTYEIQLDNENIKVIQACDWKFLTYPNLEKQIFGRPKTRKKKVDK